MAAAVTEQPPEVPQWLKTLPLAPEYHPTLAEFEDPISYILKIEKEASRYGICKIVPPVPPQPKKTAIGNLNRSLSARNPNHDSKSAPTFNTRHQQIGFCPRKPRPVQKPVWQSGENYTLQQFEVKAKHFEKTQLKKSGKKGFSALEIETLFWKASVDKPFTVEYANDMPGSAFVAVNEKKRREAGDSPASLGETAWNMRAVSRAKGSLLRFMKEEIPGVTSPMVYIAMLFSWFAWHVEDHDLHSLNYMHLGAGKTWYGVPREAAAAFEEVVRVHGYGGEVNPLVTFATLGEKTTVMSPEVLIGAGIPCCRLVQNVGEFVVTFPGAYHSGFSHGFNCGEAANIATPEWLRFAKEAAIRRASINYPPMVSHFQLLYALARTLSSRASTTTVSEPRSSRLKDKMKGEGESMVKELFVQSMLQNNSFLSALLEQGSSCVLLPQNSSEISLCSNLHAGSKRKVKPRLSLGLSSDEEAPGASTVLLSDDIMLDRNVRLRHLNGFSLVNGKSLSSNGGDRLASLSLKDKQCENDDMGVSTSVTRDTDDKKESTSQGSGLLDQRLFSCVTCGILSYACGAVVQPREAASRYLMSADCSSFNDWNVGSGVLTDGCVVANAIEDTSELDKNSGLEKNCRDDLYDVPVQSGGYHAKFSDQNVKAASDSGDQRGISSLELLAFAYGNSSDSDEEPVEPEVPGSPQNDDLGDQPLSGSGNIFPTRNNFLCGDSGSHSPEPEYQEGATACSCASSPENEVKHAWTSLNLKGRCQHTSICSLESGIETLKPMASNYFNGSFRDPAVFTAKSITGSAEHQNDVKMEKLECGPADYSRPLHPLSNSSPANRLSEINKSTNIDVSMRNANMLFLQRSDEDSTRKHLFCLEHAVEVEKQLRPIGGAHMLLVCHPEYPKVEAEAKLLAEDLGIDCLWKEITFRAATSEDGEMIRSALDDEEAIPGNLDWTVKLGINLYYSANLSRSPLYTKQMPYNSIIYKVFGCNSLANSAIIPKVNTRGLSKQKKIVVAGKWCGKVWMSNQVHPYLVHRDTEEEEEEPAINFLARVATSNAKLERNAEKTHQTECAITKEETTSPHITMTTSRKLGQKWIKTFAKGKTKRRKCPQEEDNTVGAAEDSSEYDSPRVCVESLRSGQIKRENQTLSCNGLKNNSRKHVPNMKEEVDSGGPSTRLRRRPPKPAAAEESKVKPSSEKQTVTGKKKVRKAIGTSNEVKDEEADYQCDMDGCTMGFSSKQELLLHKRNICSVKGCGKKFFSHKYLVQHRRVHMDDRPLKCPWKGCKMTFKWPWARTEHIRVHTGARPYICREPGCGQTFRFVSDFSRHKRKTGHSVKGKG